MEYEFSIWCKLLTVRDKSRTIEPMISSKSFELVLHMFLPKLDEYQSRHENGPTYKYFIYWCSRHSTEMQAMQWNTKDRHYPQALHIHIRWTVFSWYKMQIHGQALRGVGLQPLLYKHNGQCE